jgi:hypothetical protein
MFLTHFASTKHFSTLAVFLLSSPFLSSPRFPSPRSLSPCFLQILSEEEIRRRRDKEKRRRVDKEKSG